MNEDFRPAVRLRYCGDAAVLAPLRREALQALEAMRRENVFGLAVYGRETRLPSGGRIVCRRVGEQDVIEIHGPARRESGRLRRPAVRPRPERDGTFYAIPGCLARYEGLTRFANAIPDGDLAGWELGLGAGVTVVEPALAGLPEPLGLPEAGIDREVGVFTLPGGAASGLLYGRAHIPDAAPFSVSCLVRLREYLEYDYTYDARSLPNPIRAYLLQGTGDGVFAWDCPGGIAPVIGFCSPHVHPDWVETVTYPWTPWNANYRSKTEQLLGAKRAASACPGAPSLATAYPRDAAGNAYPYPDGFVMGLQAAGLFLASGNRLLGVRLSHFETQTGYVPAVTDPLELGLWHHVVMTHEADGAVQVYVAREDAAEAAVYGGVQPLCAMDAACVYQASGVNAWTLRNGLTGAAIGAYRMNPAMDVALPRFFHYALSPVQAWLLQLEALAGLFVADDHEAAQGAALGFVPITVSKEAS